MDNRREMIKDVLMLAKGNGCKVYISPKGNSLAYGYMIFPDETIIGIYDNVLYGWDFSIQYMKSSYNGKGCICNVDPVTEVTWEKLQTLKRNGIEVAKALHAKMYKTSQKWEAKEAVNMIKL